MADIQTLWSIQILDALGVTANHDIFVKVADSTSLANLATAVQSYMVLLDPITDGAQKKCEVRLIIPVPVEVVPSPQEGSEVERTGLFNFAQTGSIYKYGIDVPALKDELIVNGKIDLTNADLLAWVDWLKNAHTGIQAVSKFLLTFGNLLDALISFRKHRKAETRRSLSVPS